MNNLQQLRTDFNKFGQLYPKYPGVEVRSTNIGGVPSHWLTPAELASEAVVLYLHGGGYFKGGLGTYESLLTHLSARLHMRVLLPEYRLAPEFPFPAAINDSLAVYHTLLKGHAANKIFLMGDSAGGGLVVAAIKALAEQQQALPGAAVLLSPWLSLGMNGASYTINQATDLVITQAGLQQYAAWYAGDQSLEDVSPDNSLPLAFPPVLLQVAAGELVLDDSRHFHQNIAKVQPHSILSVYNNVAHVWPLADVHSAHARFALAQIDTFLSTYC